MRAVVSRIAARLVGDGRYVAARGVVEVNGQRVAVGDGIAAIGEQRPTISAAETSS